MKAQTSPINAVTKTTWDGTLRVVATAAWLLSLAALCSTASADDLTRTAVRPPAARIATDFGTTDDFSPARRGVRDGRTFERGQFGLPSTPSGVRCKDGQCTIPSATPVRTNRPNFRDIFDVPGLNEPRLNGPRLNEPISDHFDAAPAADDWTRTPAADPYATPAPGFADEPTALEKIDGRYGNPLFVQMGRSATLGSAVGLYTEASNLIDTRHVSPLSYERRTAGALEGVATALESTGFRRAAGLTASRAQIAPVQQQLRSLARRPARSSRDAVGQMQQAASLVSRSLNVPEGMVAMEFLHSSIDSLDRFSAIVPRQTAMSDVEPTLETATIDGRTAGLEENIVGVGVEMKTDPRGAIVMGTVEGGPAAESGLRRGDVITAVNGQTIAGMSLGEAAGLIGGPAGSQVRFNVDRDGRTGTITMNRRSIYVSSVANVQMLDGNAGYARLKQFSANSAKDLQNAMWKLHRQGMDSFVLDLRGNPGGLLTAAIEISDMFLPCGSIVETRGRTGEDNTRETANYTKTWRTPLVVLIDDGSASASEILAAAIQDNDRGVVVGRRSYGKGTVQTHFPLRSVTGNFKLTTAKFYSPKGREMAGQGVAPDVSVAGETDWSAAADRDRDVLAATRVLADGRPQSLAAAASRCRVQNTARPAYPRR